MLTGKRLGVDFPRTASVVVVTLTMDSETYRRAVEQLDRIVIGFDIDTRVETRCPTDPPN
jgi:hypothetical protein